MRPILTLHFVATNEHDFENCILGIAEADFLGKTRLIVMHTLDKEWIKAQLIARLKEKKNLAFVAKKIKSEFVQPHKFLKFFALRGVFRNYFLMKKISPFREEELRMQRVGYLQAMPRINGKYLLVLTQKMRLKKNFWEVCITPLEREKKAAVLVAAVERMGAEKVGFLKRPVAEKCITYKKGEGILPFLIETQIEEKLIVIKRKKIRKFRSKYITVDFASDKYIFNHGVACRFAMVDGIIQDDFGAEAIVDPKEIKEYESLESVVLRLAFLKGYVWHYNVPHGYKYNTDKLKEAYQEALNKYGDSVSIIKQFYEKEGNLDLEARYGAFLEAIKA